MATAGAASWGDDDLAGVEAARSLTEALYLRHADAVTRICRVLLRDRAEAEDAAQQVFLSAHRSLLNGALPREPAAWLATIARNECCARRRAHTLAPMSAPADVIERASPSVSSEAVQRAELAVLWREIARLPKAQREALLLREIRGLSYDQLADDLALSGPSVRSLLNRARQRLRQRLEHIRTTLGAISGFDALARLIAGGANPAGPAASKAVALGLGAIAVTGGAALTTPGMLEHHLVRQMPARVALPSPGRSANAHPMPRPNAIASVPIERLRSVSPRKRSVDTRRSVPAVQVGSGVTSNGDRGGGDESGVAVVAAPSSSGDGGDQSSVGVEPGSVAQDAGGSSPGGNSSLPVRDTGNDQSGGPVDSPSAESIALSTGDGGDSSGGGGDVLSSSDSGDGGGGSSDGGGSGDLAGSGG